MGKEFVLKVTIVEQTNSVKSVRVDEELTVAQAIVTIKAKTEINQSTDHFLFLPEQSRMLAFDSSIASYGLNGKDETVVELRSKTAVLKINLIDGTNKAMLLDVTADPNDMVAFIGKKLELKITEEFGLQLENSEWLEPGSPVVEQLRGAVQLRLRKKFFMSDQNVDMQDPAQLHLVYSECKESVHTGTMPCTPEEIVALTALQLQIEKGDVVPGYTPDLSVYLPPQYLTKSNGWDKSIERGIVADWKRHAKMPDINGKYRYVQLTRALKTFGITTFKVQEKVAGSRKLVDGLLGITRSSVVKMTDNKVIVQDWPLRMIKRWAAGEGAFTLDFGNHAGNYYMVFTKEGDRISKLLSGYIDLIMKKQRDTGQSGDDENLDTADVEEFSAAATAKMLALRTKGTASGQPGGTSIHMTLAEVKQMIERALAQYSQQGVGEGSVAGKMDAPRMLADIANALSLTISDVLSGDKQKMGQALRELASQIQMLQNAYQAAYAAGIGAGVHSLSGEDNLLFVCKEATDALLKLLNSESAQQAMYGKPGQADQERWNPEMFYARAALTAVACQARSLDANPIEAQRLLMELSRNIEGSIQDMCQASELLSLRDPAAVDKAKDVLKKMGEQSTKVTRLLAATAADPQAQQVLGELGNAIKSAVVSLMDAARANTTHPDDEYMKRMWEAASAVSKAVEALLQGSLMSGVESSEQAMLLFAAAQDIIGQLGTLLDPDVTKAETGNAIKSVHDGIGRLVQVTKGIAVNDSSKKDGIVKGTKQLIESLKQVESSVDKGPESAEVKNAVDTMRLAVQDILREAGYVELGKSLKTALIGAAGKQALAQVLALHNQSSQACRSMRGDKDAQSALLNCCMNILPGIDKFLNLLSAPSDKQEAELVQAVCDFIPEAADLVAGAKTAVPAVSDTRSKAGVSAAATSAARAIRDLNYINNAYKPHGITALGEELKPVFEEMDKIRGDLQGMMKNVKESVAAGQAANAEQVRENAFRMLNAAIRQIGNCVGRIQTIPLDDVPQEADNILKATRKLMAAVKAMLGTTADPEMHKKMIGSASEVAQAVSQFTVAVAKNPKQAGPQGERVTKQMQSLLEAAKSIVAAEMEAKQSSGAKQVTDLAERELLGAANVIQEAMRRLTEAMARAQQQAQMKGVSLDETGISGAILEAARNVVQSSAELVHTATDSQREVVSLGRAKKDAVYLRDPKWEQGLISAAKAVAGSVQYLVKAANDHCNGETLWSALIAAAKTVAANSAQVQASTKSKLSQTSPNLQKMGGAVGKVNNATASLVKVASAKDQDPEEDSEDPTATSETQLKILQMDAQVHIINLEKQIADAVIELGNLRKQRYEEAYANFQRRFAPNEGGAPSSRSPPPAGAPRQASAGGYVKAPASPRGGPGGLPRPGAPGGPPPPAGSPRGAPGGPPPPAGSPRGAPIPPPGAGPRPPMARPGPAAHVDAPPPPPPAEPEEHDVPPPPAARSPPAGVAPPSRSPPAAFRGAPAIARGRGGPVPPPAGRAFPPPPPAHPEPSEEEEAPPPRSSPPPPARSIPSPRAGGPPPPAGGPTPAGGLPPRAPPAAARGFPPAPAARGPPPPAAAPPPHSGGGAPPPPPHAGGPPPPARGPAPPARGPMPPARAMPPPRPQPGGPGAHPPPARAVPPPRPPM